MGMPQHNMSAGRGALPKIQHYVPQFLLREFAFGKKHKLHAYDKRSGRSFVTNVDRAAAESGFYNFQVPGVGLVSAEPAMGVVESKVAPIVKRIIRDASIGGLTDEERARVSLFVAVQLTRTRNYRNMLGQGQTPFAGWLRSLGYHPALIDGWEEPNEEMLARQQAMTTLSAHELAPFVDDKAWVLLHNPTSQPYYTSDNPVALQNTKFQGAGTLGLGVAGIEIYLPLTPRLTLSMVCTSHEETMRDIAGKSQALRMVGAFPDELKENSRQVHEMLEAIETGRPLTQKAENVLNQNALQVKSATRYVYSHTDEFTLAEQMLLTDPGLGVRVAPSW
jgi:hypothetical protein